jgi:hypothetical protein
VKVSVMTLVYVWHYINENALDDLDSLSCWRDLVQMFLFLNFISIISFEFSRNVHLHFSCPGSSKWSDRDTAYIFKALSEN